MNEWIFNERNLELLNELVFDSSINIESLKKLSLIDNSIQFEIERRAFEDVTRKKFILWNKSYIKGKTSKLVINDVINFKGNLQDLESNLINDFIIEFLYNSSSHIINLKTIHNENILTIEVRDKFNIHLIDITESTFGEGSCFGKVGFTKEEWKDKMKII